MLCWAFVYEIMFDYFRAVKTKLDSLMIYTQNNKNKVDVTLLSVYALSFNGGKGKLQ